VLQNSLISPGSLVVRGSWFVVHKATEDSQTFWDLSFEQAIFASPRPEGYLFGASVEFLAFLVLLSCLIDSASLASYLPLFVLQY